MAGAAKSAAKSANKPVPKSANKEKAAPAGKLATQASPPAASVKKARAPQAEKAPEKAKPTKAEAPALSKEPAAADLGAAGKPAKPKKQKLVRDSFTMPESEYALLGEVKKACIANGFEVKKSELLRVGVALIRTLDNASLKNWIESLPPLKPGRPRKEKAA